MLPESKETAAVACQVDDGRQQRDSSVSRHRTSWPKSKANTIIHQYDVLWFEYVLFISWLLKDTGWVLLIFPLGMAAAAVALAVEVYQLPMRRRVCTAAVAVHREALLLWLIGNIVWMGAEWAFDPLSEAGQQFMWNSGPLVGGHGNERFYTWGVDVTRFIMIAGLLHLVILYAKNFWIIFDKSQRHEDCAWGLITPEVYSWCFAGPWILKDILWSLGFLYAALFCGMIVAVLMLDCWRRYLDVIHIAEFLWLTGNVMWVYAECTCGLKDAYLWPRQAAAAFLLLGVLVTLSEFRVLLGGSFGCFSVSRTARKMVRLREP